MTRTVPLDVSYLGEWRTPFWVGDESTGELRRIGFEALARINRHDFGVSWQDELPGGGVVVSNEIELVLDAEAILLEDLERTGAIEYYRASVASRISFSTPTAPGSGFSYLVAKTHAPPATSRTRPTKRNPIGVARLRGNSSGRRNASPRRNNAANAVPTRCAETSTTPWSANNNAAMSAATRNR